MGRNRISRKSSLSVAGPAWPVLRSRHLKNKGQSSSTAEPLDKAARELTTKEGGEDHLPSEATAVVLPQHPEPLTGKGALGGKL